MKFLFDFIKDELNGQDFVSFSTWHSSPHCDYFDEIKEIFEESSMVEYDGQKYIITREPPTNGRGGMDEGSPETFTVQRYKSVEIKKIVKRPMPVKNPDFSKVIEDTESIIEEIANGTWHEDNDDAHYLYEAVMCAVYGDNIFDWINKNT